MNAVSLVSIFFLALALGMKHATEPDHVIAVSTVASHSFVLSSRRTAFHSLLTKLTSAISVVFGLYYMYSLGIGEGLFQTWF